MMIIKDYEIIKELGTGGMGVVYLARDLRLGRDVAIKKIQLKKETASEFQNESMQRFFREARVLASLNHPNIIKIYEFLQDEEIDFIGMVMEYVDGYSLDSFSTDELLPVEHVLQIALQACDALYYIHKKNIIHRDIKPANIILNKNGLVKIMDFGISKAEDEKYLTKAGTLIGSVLFMAPEQISTPQNVDHRIDVYSLGITLYNLLSGRFPYETDNTWDLMTKILSDDPVPLYNMNPFISLKLSNIIMKAISKDREQRYTNMYEMMKAFEELNQKNSHIPLPSLNNKVTRPLPPVQTLLTHNKPGAVNELEKTVIIHKDDKTNNNLEKTVIFSENEFDYFENLNNSIYLDTIAENITRLEKIKEEFRQDLASFENTLKAASSRSGINNLQKENKEERINLLDEKIRYYKLLQDSQNIRKSVLNQIKWYLDFNYTLNNNEIENAVSVLNDLLHKSREIKVLKKVIIEFKALLHKRLDIYQENLIFDKTGTIIRSIHSQNTLEIKLHQEISENTLLETDVDEYHTLWFSSRLKDLAGLRKVKAGEIVKIKHEDSLNKASLRIGHPIYKSSQRKVRLELMETEINSCEIFINEIDLLISKIFNEFNSIINSLGRYFNAESMKTQTLNSNQLMIQAFRLKKELAQLKNEALKLITDDKKSHTIKSINTAINSLAQAPTAIRDFEKNRLIEKENRKKSFQNLLYEISHSNPDILKEKQDNFLTKIEMLQTKNIPTSLVSLVKLYYVSKAKIPVDISKKSVLELLNNEKDKLLTDEINMICKLLKLTFSKEKGFLHIS